jgi:pullulanase
LLYGEGWTAGASPLPDSLRALKKYAYRLDRIAVFSDDIRDGIKGNVFEYEDKGFVSGKAGMEESIKFGIVASCKHPQVDYSKVNYSKAAYSAQPWSTITYCECHDNHVLWDKLAISAKNTTESERKEMYKVALSIVLTSQGIAFLHAGTEFLRTKKGVENSFESPDSINALDWRLKTENKDIFEYVKALIKMRNEHPAFRMTSANQSQNNIEFRNGEEKGVISYIINGVNLNDRWKKILVFFNGNSGQRTGTLPPGKWKTAIWNNQFLENSLFEDNQVFLGSYSCSIFFRE